MNETTRGDKWRDYTELQSLLRDLADKARLNIIHVLAGAGEVTVTHLTQALLISQPLVSWHLTILRRHGLVQTRRQGRLVFCSLNMKRYRQCLGLLGELIDVPPPAAPPGSDVTRTASEHPAPISGAYTNKGIG